MLKSKFVENYTNGAFKEKYWEMVLEDAMDLIAKVPTIAALVYNKLYKHKMFLPMHNPNLDWAGNFATKLGISSGKFQDLVRLFMIIYSDWTENITLTGSALSDPFKCYSSGLEHLGKDSKDFEAHEIIPFLFDIKEQTQDQSDLIIAYLTEKFKDQSIPGFSSKVFPNSDPRYDCFASFAKKNLSENELFKLLMLVTQSLKESKPELVPTVDLISGVLLHHYGIREHFFYPVMYGIARSLGLLSRFVWDRALGVPLEKHKSLPTVNTIPDLKIHGAPLANLSVADKIKAMHLNPSFMSKAIPSSNASLINSEQMQISNLAGIQSSYKLKDIFPEGTSMPKSGLNQLNDNSTSNPAKETSPQNGLSISMSSTEGLTTKVNPPSILRRMAPIDNSIPKTPAVPKESPKLTNQFSNSQIPNAIEDVNSIPKAMPQASPFIDTSMPGGQFEDTSISQLSQCGISQMNEFEVTAMSQVGKFQNSSMPDAQFKDTSKRIPQDNQSVQGVQFVAPKISKSIPLAKQAKEMGLKHKENKMNVLPIGAEVKKARMRPTNEKRKQS